MIWLAFIVFTVWLAFVSVLVWGLYLKCIGAL